MQESQLVSAEMVAELLRETIRQSKSAAELSNKAIAGQDALTREVKALTDTMREFEGKLEVIALERAKQSGRDEMKAGGAKSITEALLSPLVLCTAIVGIVIVMCLAVAMSGSRVVEQSINKIPTTSGKP